MPYFVYVTAFSIRAAINNLNIYSDFRVFSIKTCYNLSILNKLRFILKNKEIINDAKKKMMKKKEII